MRTSILSRSVIAVASLAIASAALTVAPANAATTPSVTRDLILTATKGLRITAPTEAQFRATKEAMQKIAIRSCGLDPELNEVITLGEYEPVVVPGSADGLLIRAGIINIGIGLTRTCTFAAFATTDPAFKLSGSVIISGVKDDDAIDPVSEVLGSGTLSENVFVTAPTEVNDYLNVSAWAWGSATKTSTVTTTKKVSTPKTASQKKAAKKKYDAAVKAAKKKYSKAGKTKKAKQVMTKSISRAKKVYKLAIASYKIVKKTTTKTDKRPFSVATRTF